MDDPEPEAVGRILLKLSGEALSSDGFGIDNVRLGTISEEISAVVRDGVQIGIVVGGGNFFRGIQGAASGMDRISGDHIGMLATVMNGIALRQSLLEQGIEARVLSAVAGTPLVEPYVHARALKHLKNGRVVIFTGGTGNPLFTTDTAATLRAIEIKADLLLKATKVDGVYSDDPVLNPAATRYDAISYDEVLAKRLAVMDATAVTLAREHKLPMRVFSIHTSGQLQKIVRGSRGGTLVNETGAH